MSGEKSKFIEEIDQFLTDAICAEDEEKKIEFLQLAKIKGEEFLTEFPEDSDASHMMGLVIYAFSGLEKLQIAEKYFAAAVKINPKNQFAIMYLGHCYFDTKRFSDALVYFEKINEDYFILDDKLWRIIKLHELILCCQIQTNLIDNFLEKFTQFINELKVTPDEDIPVPFEFAQTLAETKNSLLWQKVDREKVVEKFSQRLSKLGYEITLKEYIERF